MPNLNPLAHGSLDGPKKDEGSWAHHEAEKQAAIRRAKQAQRDLEEWLYVMDSE